MSSRESSRRGSNAYSNSSLSSNGSSITATRDLWRLRQTMHCLEKCPFYHGSLNRNAAREKMRRCKPGCYLIRDSNDPQYLFTLQQTLHFVGPCATRIAFIQGLFRFQDSTGVENGARENRGFPCVVSLIEHYAAKYREMDVLALRYPVSKDDVIHEEAEEHHCFVESPNEDAAETPRRIHPELAASLAGSTQTCNSCTSHSGPTRLEYQDANQNCVAERRERVNRRSNSDGALSTGFSEKTRRSTIHASDISTEMKPNELRQSLNGLKERIENEIEMNNQPNLEEIFPGIEPLISTVRRNSADRHFKKASLDPYFSCESMMHNTLPTQQQHEKSSRRSSRKSIQRSREELAEIDRDYNFSSSLGNVKIDLDDLGAILGGTSITVANDD